MIAPGLVDRTWLTQEDQRSRAFFLGTIRLSAGPLVSLFVLTLVLSGFRP